MWGERSVGIVLDDAGTRRVRFCQRPDALFTYYVEERADGPTGGKQQRWDLLRDAGLFTEEAAMRQDARLHLAWPEL